MRWTIVRRGLRVSAVAAVALGALIAVAHLPAARPLLRRWGTSTVAKAGCPLGYDRPMTAADREAERARFKQTHQGRALSLGHPALGFALGSATRADVQATMRKAGVTCRPSKGMADLTCEGVVARALPAAAGDDALARNVWFTFGKGEHLIAVVAVSRDDHAQPVSAAFAAATADLRQNAGNATANTGDSAPAALAAGPLRQATAEFRFADYYAVARATNMGNGFLLTEEYRSLVN